LMVNKSVGAVCSTSRYNRFGLKPFVFEQLIYVLFVSDAYIITG